MAEKQERQQGDLNQVVDPLNKASNILVTISTDPTVDQFAACIGLTLVLNKLGKHATAVFSGEVPSTIEFLKPEKTLEKNTDSLRDFIIALDKSKADKLRYKVEDNVVKIFITPYKTSIDEDDLEFSQGDFNVDAVIALGVSDKGHLDQAIVSHGRILHDATVISVNNQLGSHIGTINWTDPSSSSLCEMVADISQSLSKDVFDTQTATAFLTGIVAETDRYSNEKASPHTMSIAGVLMSAGASTQLVSSELEKQLKGQSLPVPKDISDETEASSDGQLQIDHTSDLKAENDQKKEEAPEPEPTSNDQVVDKKNEDNDELLSDLNLSPEPAATTPEPEQTDKPGGRLIKEPPQFSGQLTANSVPEEQQYSGSIDPLSVPNENPILDKEQKTVNEPDRSYQSDIQDKLDKTLEEIEESVSSPHIENAENPGSQSAASEPTSVGEVAKLSVDEARRATEEAANGSEERPQPREDVGSAPLDQDQTIFEDPEEKSKQQFNSNGSDSNGNNGPPPPVPPPLTPPAL